MNQSRWPHFQNGSILDIDESVLLAEILPHSPRSVWLAGSIIEGLGTATSDLDIYAVVKSIDDIPGLTRRSQGKAIKVVFMQGRRLDIEFWEERSLDGVIKSFAEIPLENPNANIVDALDEESVQLIARIHLSKPIFGGDFLQELRRSIHVSRFCSYLRENKRHYVDDAFDDTTGAHLAGDYQSACLRARDTVEFSVDVLLHACGRINVKHKHRWRLMSQLTSERPELKPIQDKYWRLATLIPSDQADMRDYIEKALEFSELIMMQFYNENHGGSSE